MSRVKSTSRDHGRGHGRAPRERSQFEKIRLERASKKGTVVPKKDFSGADAVESACDEFKMTLEQFFREALEYDSPSGRVDQKTLNEHLRLFRKKKPKVANLFLDYIGVCRRILRQDKNRAA